MKNRSWGRIINISSQMAFLGGARAAAYCASKAGVIGLTRALAIEAAPHGTLVNCIAPGATQTDMLDACGDALKASILAEHRWVASAPPGRSRRSQCFSPPRKGRSLSARQSHRTAATSFADARPGTAAIAPAGRGTT